MSKPFSWGTHTPPLGWSVRPTDLPASYFNNAQEEMHQAFSEEGNSAMINASNPANLEAAESLALALHILSGLDGLSVAQARRVLREADAWLDQSAQLDCSSTSFQQAAEELRRASGESA